MATNHVARPRRKEDPNRFIKRFQRKCKKLGIFDDVRGKRYFKKLIYFNIHKILQLQKEKYQNETYKRKTTTNHQRRSASC